MRRLLRNALWALAFIAMLTVSTTVEAADKSGVSPNTISLPKGPGSIEGLGEAFQPTLNTGTAKYRIGLALPAGTTGHTPQVALSYEGGAGNGPIGFGWRLPTAYVQRQMDKGIPRYVDAANGADDDHDGTVDNVGELDVFINELKEELVPRLDGFYFCENEGSFIRYKRVGDHWEATLPDGTRLEFGLTAAGRVQDATSGRVFSWLVERVTETHGNVIRYTYQSFTNEANLNQRYLAKIEYGPGGLPWRNFHFVSFAYEDRKDWFEDCRSGFPIRTGKRLREIAIGTQGPTLANHRIGDLNGDGTPDNLVRKYSLGYWAYAGTNSHWSYLATVTPTGADGASSLPSSRFTYSICDPPDVLSAAGKVIGGENVPPFVMDNPLVDLVDLNGDGAPDILKTSLNGGVHSGYINLGETNGPSGSAIRWSSPVEVASPDGLAWNINLRSGNQPSENIAHLADMDGDGMADLVYRTPFASVFYFKNLGRQSWAERRAMSTQDQAPPSPFGQANVKTADIDFNKDIDIIQSLASGGYRIWFNLGNQRYSQSVTVPQDIGFALSEPGVEIADFNGDRVPDICRIRPTTIEVTVGWGYGNFAPLELVLIPDATLDTQEISRAKLQDITGDGLADIVIERAEPGTCWYWINLGNYAFSSRKVITGLPLTPAEAAIRWADLNANGTTDYIVASGDNIPAIQAVDLG
ncbi:MAG: SpvB/TcaC N-terminal domain-containing protein, partial [Pirellulaceae bacterium]